MISMRLDKYIALLLTLSTALAYGQTKKGKVFTGANSNFVTSFKKDISETFIFRPGAENKSKSSQLSAQLGYFLIDNLVIGVGFGFNTSAEKSTSESESVFGTNTTEIKNTEKTTQTIPFAKYYFSEKKFKPYVIVSYGFGKRREIQSIKLAVNGDVVSSEESEVGKNYSLRVLNLGAGAAFFITDFLSLELGLNYSNTYIDSETFPDLKGIKANFGLFLFF